MITIQRHTISILLENESGALSRVAGLFSARGYNIESLNVSMTNDPSLSRMTLVTSGDEQTIEQIIKQLNKLVDVVKLMDLAEHKHIERELMMVKISAKNIEACAGIKRIADIFRARVIDIANKTYTIEVTGGRAKIEAFLDAMKDHGIQEVVRSGALGIVRGSATLKVDEKA